MYDVVALGEVLIDFTPAGKSDNGNPLFECNPGGAPANVLACLAKLGKQTSFIGKVGSEMFGRFLRQVLEERGIGTEWLLVDEKVNTTLAFVHLEEDGERSFSFHGSPGADTRLEPGDVEKTQFRSKIFHFGSLSLTHEPARSATRTALKWAREQGMLVSYDPNLRPLLWSSLDEARTQMLAVMDQAHIVKISREELEFLTGTSDLKSGMEQLYQDYGLKLLLVTMGKEGCHCKLGPKTCQLPGFKVNAVDATGAGDAFLGGMLYQILERGDLLKWGEGELAESARFANAVGALATTRKGGIPAMPTLAEVERFLKGGD